MKPFGKRPPGLLRVTQLSGNQTIVRDFDNEEWSYQWYPIGDQTMLRLNHDRDPDATISFDYVDFSAPVNVEFIGGEQ